MIIPIFAISKFKYSVTEFKAIFNGLQEDKDEF